MNELKTLKDFEEGWVEDYQIVPKEYTHLVTQTQVIEIKELKTEAIKWIKEEIEISKWDGGLTNKCIKRWMERFNLIQEDIEEQTE